MELASGSPSRDVFAPPVNATAVRYLDALDIFTRGDLERVRSITPRWMAEYSQQSDNNATSGDPLISSCTPLHLAVQCPRKDVIAAILETGLVPVDAADAHGMTALHLAAKASRKDVVKLLLRHNADDMLLDAQGQDALAYATEAEVAAVIQDHRAEMIRITTARLLLLVRNKENSGVQALLANQAESARVNLAARDPESGGTLLHLAVQHGMLDLARWAITEGIDVFAVDKAGNLAEKYATSEHHRMRELLSQAPMGNARTALSGRAPKFSGELHKWTNYAGGWKSRWLELEDGVLSYYKNKADADSACRGAINLRIAKILMIKENSQFEVHGKGSIKYRLKAADAAVAKQWVHLLNVSKQWALENHRKTDVAGDGSAESESTQAADTQSQTRARTSSLLRVNNSADASSIKSAPQHVNHSSKSQQVHARGASTSSTEIQAGGSSLPPPQTATPQARGTPGTAVSRVSSMMSNPSGDDDDEDDDNLYIARETFFSTLGELRSQLFIQDRLLEGLGKSRHANQPQQLLTSPEERSQYLSIAAQTSEQSRVLLDALDRAYRNSISGWKTRLRHEQERIDMLADSLRAAVVSSTTGPQQIISQQDIRMPVPDASDLDLVGVPGEAEEYDSDSDFADATDEFFDTVTSATASLLARAGTAESELEPKVVPDSEVSTTPLPPAPTVQPLDLTALSGYAASANIRCSLPEISSGKPSLNLWSVIKGAIGKDLSQISVPVFFNEPTSFLQRFTEDMEYCDLLEIATRVPRSEDRTLFVAGFAMSNYASTFGRIAKPFNPLLGETFEYVRPDKKYRALSEQVEHHPPISACWVEGRNYLYHADTNVKTRFNGGSLTVVPTGVCHVELKLPLAFLDRDEELKAGDPRQPPRINEEEGYFVEHYTWNKLTTNVNGLMIASFWIEHVGDLEVLNHRTGDITKLTFMQSGWTGKNKFKVTGDARNRRGEQVYEVAGDWTSKLVAKPVGSSSSTASPYANNVNNASVDIINCPANSSNADDAVDVPRRPFVLWKANERAMTGNSYHLTTYAMSLNDRPPELEPFLCPTDSRFRPDQRAMETGTYDLADREKSRLENKQRATRRRREQGELPAWKPRWFVRDMDADSGESYWRFSGDYWPERESAAAKIKNQDGAHGSSNSVKPAAIEAWDNVEDIF
ncbi:hypothetical protein GGI19_004754 [Coemansia pectinata]|uniref:PH domain-containing protein n=1 Tax=Coemansia pectinata TaxID=1052879 RepID=A0A9W8L939_9FUNG|nr:hypothetical protein GGI19_004754 [Coemansia pectinata]